MALPRFFVGLIALLALTAQSTTGSSLRSTETEENMSIPRRLKAQDILPPIFGPNLFCYPEDNFDFVDHDIGNAPAPLASQCCSLCNAKPGCNAYSWSNFNGGTCWYKSQRGPVIFKPGVKSAVIFHTAQPTCTIQINTDYVDNDLARVNSATAGGCCNLCRAYPGCRAFSWTNYLGGSCWLKSAKGATIWKFGVRSAEVYPSPIVVPPVCTIQNNVDYFDHDIGNVPSPTAEGCCSICKGWGGCNAFSWSNFNGGTCWLKSSAGTSVPTAGVRSAVVV